MHGEYKVPGGKLVVIDFEVIDEHLSGVQVSGDFFLEPASARDGIDSALEGLPAGLDEASLISRLQPAFGGTTQAFGITPQAVAIALRRALGAGEAT